MYNIRKFIGMDGAELIVHMCAPFNLSGSRVEIYTLGGQCVVLTKEQFEEVTEWVAKEFEKLASKKSIVQ